MKDRYHYLQGSGQGSLLAGHSELFSSGHSSWDVEALASTNVSGEE